jgi:hypothetical protein
MRIATVVIVVVVLVIALLIAPGFIRHRKLQNYVDLMAHLGEMAQYDRPKGPPVETESGVNHIKTTPFEASLTFDEMAGFNPNAGVLWPGALVQGGSLRTGNLAPIPVAQAAETVVISNVSPTAGTQNVRYAEFVDHPTYGSAEAARQKLVAQALAPNAKFSYSASQFYSVDDAMLRVGASASYLGASIKAQLESESYKSKTNLIAKFTQEYYTVAGEPRSVTNFFAKGTAPESLKRFSDPVTNPITYVQSVTYGRMALLVISSEYSYDRLKKAVDAAYNSMSGGASGSYTNELQSIVENSEMKLIVFGGDAGAALQVVAADAAHALPAFQAWITNNGKPLEIKTGVPISYRISYLKDSQIARLSFVTDYQRVEISPLPQLVDWKISFNTANDNKDDDTMLSVSIDGPNGPVAHWDQNGRDEFGNGSTKDINMTRDGILLVRDLGKANLHFHIETNGDDHWDFSFTIQARNTAGGNWVKSSGSEWLSESNKTLNKHLADLSNF